MQTLSQPTQQALATLNSSDAIRKPILDFSTDVVYETLVQAYLLLVALDTNAIREGYEKDLMCMARWLTRPNKQGMILQGNVGTGKTTIARAMWAVMRFHGAPAKGCVASELANIYKNDEKNAWWQLMNASRLFIDDLGTEYTSTKNYGDEFSPILAIINRFHKDRKTLIITTNLSMQDIAQRYGERIADRLSEICNHWELSNTQTYRR